MNSPRSSEMESTTPISQLDTIDELQEKEYVPVSEETSYLTTPPPPNPSFEKRTEIKHFANKRIEVLEDFYGSYIDEIQHLHLIKRYTWRNHNKIEVQVINYGARIVSMKLPDKFGHIEDVALGFDDIAGYSYYDKYPLGATIGRCCNVIEKGQCVINNTVCNLNLNDGAHHYNGGSRGFDREVWTAYVKGSQVIMSHISHHNDQGYPGDLLTTVTFELSERNEFKIDVEAHCTQPTVVNITNLVYLNLAGHNRGPNEIYRHIVTLNCNCFTPQVEKLPTGEIRNVVHSGMDFQIPRTLGKCIGLRPNDGFAQNFCVNTGVEQGDCFAARLLHPPTGRLVEIYSTHPGIYFTTANEFGFGEDIPLSELLRDEENKNCSNTALFMENIYKHLLAELQLDQVCDFSEIRELIELVKKMRDDEAGVLENLKLTPLQEKYLKNILGYCMKTRDNEMCLRLTNTIQTILSVANQDPKNEDAHSESAGSKASNGIDGILKTPTPKESPNVSLTTSKKSSKNSGSLTKKETTSSVKKEPNEGIPIPKVYRDGKIHGKFGIVYRMHGGIALTPQNYPNAVNINSFPNAILKPGDTYKNSTTYKFWIRAGNPNKWIRRNNNEAKKLRPNRDTSSSR